ncbi:hypothetical protein BDP27DRAFT_1367258 [Rhodocollybia butyracea]|uniref:Uncharacterized protein n=1 Tax=Rhodocollybia butyracea TaxID=206335 RepID=A0A9P5PJ60_9AGAR|nr:hypothetical protein BDP27DRAFT_1367258 [Rhodocollybia butyracea]
MGPFASIEIFAVDFSDEETIWVVANKDAHLLSSITHFFGRQLHFRPEENSVFRPHRNPKHPPGGFLITEGYKMDPILRIDPRFPSVTPVDISLIILVLPFVCGLTVFQYGEVELIINGVPESVLADHEWPLTIGDLPYFVTSNTPGSMVPLSHTVPCGKKVHSWETAPGQCLKPGGSLGIRIIGPDNETYITTTTHGFVPTPQPAFVTDVAQKTRRLFANVSSFLWKKALYFARPTVPAPNPWPPYKPFTWPSSPEPPVTSIPFWVSKVGASSLGAKVFSVFPIYCARKRGDIGKITATYDFPSSTQPYPSGYTHDLSFITGENLPQMVALPGLPRLTGFIPYESVFEYRSNAIFTVTYPYVSAGNSSIDSDGKTLDRVTDLTVCQPVLSGAQWIFPDAHHISRAILWRSSSKPDTTGRKDEIGKISVSDFVLSGPVLCVGDSDIWGAVVSASAQVLCFQNFQKAIPSRFGPRPDFGDPSASCYKGGFKLPQFVYDSRIDTEGMAPSDQLDLSLDSARATAKTRRKSL